MLHLNKHSPKSFMWSGPPVLHSLSSLEYELSCDIGHYVDGVFLGWDYLRFRVCGHSSMPTCVENCFFGSVVMFPLWEYSPNTEITLFTCLVCQNNEKEKPFIKKKRVNSMHDYFGPLFGLLRSYKGRIYSNALTLLEIAGEGTPRCRTHCKIHYRRN